MVDYGTSPGGLLTVAFSHDWLCRKYVPEMPAKCTVMLEAHARYWRQRPDINVVRLVRSELPRLRVASTQDVGARGVLCGLSAP
jgi:hypothetical protein